MTVGEIALLVGLLLNAVAVAWGHWQTRQVREEIHKIEVATNSMKDALVKATGEEAFQRGDAHGRAAAKHE